MARTTPRESRVQALPAGTVCGKSLTQGERVWLNKRSDPLPCAEFANYRCAARQILPRPAPQIEPWVAFGGLELLRAGSATVNPRLHLSGGVRPVERRQRTAVTGTPAPS